MFLSSFKNDVELERGEEKKKKEICIDGTLLIADPFLSFIYIKYIFTRTDNLHSGVLYSLALSLSGTYRAHQGSKGIRICMEGTLNGITIGSTRWHLRNKENPYSENHDLLNTATHKM